MINFTVGPVQTWDSIKEIGKENIPYFRTEEFSNVMFENERLIQKFLNVPKDYRTVFITGSGTSSMEACVVNFLTKEDKALVVNGGSFGHRFVELLEMYEIPFDEIKLNFGEKLTKEHLSKYNPENYTTFLVNIHETSSGVHYDLNLIDEFCKKNNLFLIVDAISSFLADELDGSAANIDAIIIGSQKALACPPGISIITMSPRAVDKAYINDKKCYYLNLKSALENAKRGQTPFTPAVGTLLQINERLKEIDKDGVLKEINRVKDLANYFREKIKDMPYKMVTTSPSNAVTSLYSTNKINVYDIFLKLKDEYGIWVCPNGGELKEKVFRVGHIGNLSKDDYDKLILALKEIENNKK